MINNDEIIILGDSLLMINSKICTIICPFNYPEKYISEAKELKLTMYNGINTDPKKYLVLQSVTAYVENIYSEPLLRA